MILLDLTIHGFGKFHGLSLSFSPGISVLYGHNEAGKSTIHAFLRAMLYGIRKRPGRIGLRDPYQKYLPWDMPEPFGGVLRFQHNQSVYRLTRSFTRPDPTIALFNETTGTEVSDPETALSAMLSGITETGFENTVSIGQLSAATGSAMVQELRSYVRSLHTTASTTLDPEAALALLSQEREKKQSELVPYAAKTYAGLIGELRNIEREIADPKYENQLRSLEEQKSSARVEKQDRQSRLEEALQRSASLDAALSHAGFSEGAAIQAEQEQAEQWFQQYQEESRYIEKYSRPLVPVLFSLGCLLSLLLSLFFLALYTPAGAVLFPSVPDRLPFLRHFLWLQPYPWLPALGTFLIFILILLSFLQQLLRKRTHQRQREQLKTKLQELLARHLGQSELKEGAMDALKKHYQELSDIATQRTEVNASVEQLRQELSELSQEEEQFDAALRRQNELRGELEQQLEHLSHVRTQAEQLRLALQENDRLNQEIDAITLSMEVLRELSGSIRESFGHYLNKEAGELIAEITGGAYDSMWIDQNMEVFLNTKNKLVSIEEVSSGTMDQVYLALRLAAARLLQNSAAEMLPLIFDDSFALYDEKRLAATLSFLSGRKEQLLLFTCHKREAELLEKLGIEYHLVSL